MAKLLGVDIPKLLNQNLGKLLYDGVLTRRTPGTRDPNDPTAGTNPTTATFTFKGFAGDYRQLMRKGPLLRNADGAILIVAESGTMKGVEPKPNDKITLTGDPQLGSRVATIVDKGVSRDPASATWVCAVAW